jgi:hypothetical protein
LQLLQSLTSFLLLQRDQFVGDVIFVDIRDVSDGLDPDAGGGEHFHVVKPRVGIETFLRSCSAQSVHASRSGVIGSESEKQFVGIRQGLIRKIFIHLAADLLHAGMNIGCGLGNVADFHLLARSGHRLHDADGADFAFGFLIAR